MINPFKIIGQYKKGDKFMKDYYEGLKLVGLTIGKETMNEYDKEMDKWTAQVLGAQVMNYLTGTVVDKVYNESQDQLKETIGKIKDQVERRAFKKMDEDKELQELVVYTLRLTEINDRAHWGAKYEQSPEKKQIEKILERYGDKFQYEIDATVYLNKAKGFYQKRFKGIAPISA